MYREAGHGLFGQRNWRDDNDHHYTRRSRAYSNNNKTVCAVYVYYLSVKKRPVGRAHPTIVRFRYTARGGFA